MPTLDDAARLARALPEVTETTRFGSRTWNVAGKAFAWERPFSQAGSPHRRLALPRQTSPQFISG
ncbi:MAG TPA: hypothetical protein VH089_03525 [Streptosporangiaceae bacterium]|nr:hypothetical protein [Streptosporangiaceae bacterium]